MHDLLVCNTSLVNFLDQQLCFALHAAARAATAAYRPKLDELGLTYTQLMVLMALWDEDERSVKSLGDALLLDSATLSPTLRRMEDSGFITRRRKPEDERVVVISLTEKGKLQREPIEQFQKQTRSKVQLTENEMVMLRNLSRRFCLLDNQPEE